MLSYITSSIRLVACSLLLGCLIFAAPVAQAQEAEQRTSLNLPEEHSPEGALWRAAVLPGWGQYYNQQPLKIPVVYAGLIGIAAAGIYSNDQYHLFRNVYRYAQQPEEYPQYEELAQPFLPEIEAGRTEHLRRERERFRRYRDLSVVGFVAFYGFSVLDAYVNAHLLHFDVDEDLSVQFQPTANGPGASLTFRF